MGSMSQESRAVTAILYRAYFKRDDNLILGMKMESAEWKAERAKPTHAYVLAKDFNGAVEAVRKFYPKEELSMLTGSDNYGSAGVAEKVIIAV